MEEAQLEQIVGKAWKTVEQSKQKPKPSPQKAKRHVHIKSQNTLMEEAQLEQIVGKAWQNAAVLKDKTNKARKKAAENRHKPKPHRQESIMEQTLAQKSVNQAWNQMTNSPAKGLLEISEVDEEYRASPCKVSAMSNESSFEASCSSSPSPKKSPMKEDQENVPSVCPSIVVEEF